ncbi:MAG: phosphate regulon transcriptional regulatory protein PhoB [Alphaproteobacteria bacterium]|nr:phosphate regulon transcriptional regulatory protein PhoB [Alphaproteobacteria bacterium]
MIPRLLLVEDEAALAEMLRYNLERAGFAVEAIGDGAAALERIVERPPDLVVLDWMLPGVSGLEICRRLRRRPETKALPIVMLTARGEEDDRLRGLDGGADDYMVKPFSPAELVARIRAVLRRAVPAGDGELRLGEFRLDPAGHRAWRGGRELSLGAVEFRLLRHFLARPERVFSRGQLLDAVWGREAALEPRSVDVQIKRLRAAINAAGEPDPIRTVRAVGYAFSSKPAAT